MRLWLAAIFLSIITACNNNSSAKKDSHGSDSNSSKPGVGSEVDGHGCKVSAGYQWSKLKDECVRIFEEGIRLQPQPVVSDQTTSAFIIFAGGKNQAEAFIPSEFSSIILNRTGETSSSWITPEWKLEKRANGYELKKNGVAQYVK